MCFSPQIENIYELFFGESITYCHVFVIYRYSEATLVMYLLSVLLPLSQMLGQSLEGFAEKITEALFL